MTKDVDHSECRPSLVQTVAQAVGLLIAAGFVFAHVERYLTTHGSIYTQPLGIAMLSMGFGLRLWAIATIGRDFQTAITAPQTIATHGPYRWMKHPGEWGMVALAVGGPLSLGSTATASAILLLLTPIAAWRIGKENQLLHSPRADGETTYSKMPTRKAKQSSTGRAIDTQQRAFSSATVKEVRRRDAGGWDTQRNCCL